MRRAFIVAVALSAMLIANVVVGAPAIGDKAPAFSVADMNGKTHSLSDYKGKLVVLEWTNHSCPFVRKHYSSRNMQKLQKKYTGKGVVWLTVCSSAKGKGGHMPAAAWQQKAKDTGTASSAVLLDTDGKAGKAYGARTTPHMFVVGKDGNLIYKGAIDDDRSGDPKKAATAKNYVAAALDAALAGKKVAEASTNPYGCGVKY
jgi:peroxiredoxin